MVRYIQSNCIYRTTSTHNLSEMTTCRDIASATHSDERPALKRLRPYADEGVCSHCLQQWLYLKTMKSNPDLSKSWEINISEREANNAINQTEKTSGGLYHIAASGRCSDSATAPLEPGSQNPVESTLLFHLPRAQRTGMMPISPRTLRTSEMQRGRVRLGATALPLQVPWLEQQTVSARGFKFPHLAREPSSDRGTPVSPRRAVGSCALQASRVLRY